MQQGRSRYKDMEPMGRTNCGGTGIAHKDRCGISAPVRTVVWTGRNVDGGPGGFTTGAAAGIGGAFWYD